MEPNDSTSARTAPRPARQLWLPFVDLPPPRDQGLLVLTLWSIAVAQIQRAAADRARCTLDEG